MANLRNAGAVSSFSLLVSVFPLVAVVAVAAAAVVAHHQSLFQLRYLVAAVAAAAAVVAIAALYVCAMRSGDSVFATVVCYSEWLLSSVSRPGRTDVDVSPFLVVGAAALLPCCCFCVSCCCFVCFGCVLFVGRLGVWFVWAVVVLFFVVCLFAFCFVSVAAAPVCSCFCFCSCFCVVFLLLCSCCCCCVLWLLAAELAACLWLSCFSFAQVENGKAQPTCDHHSI